MSTLLLIECCKEGAYDVRIMVVHVAMRFYFPILCAIMFLQMGWKKGWILGSLLHEVEIAIYMCIFVVLGMWEDCFSE